MGEMTMEQMRHNLTLMSEYKGDWQGIPVPLGADNPLTLNPKHPLREFYEELNRSEVTDIPIEILVGGPPANEEPEILRNHWYSRKRDCDVYVFHRGGKAFSAVRPRSPDKSMDRLKLWFTTLGASDAWEIEAEHAARETLRAMLSERQWRHYDLTGTFLETSPRSHISYMFRRLRPTIAMSPRLAPGALDDSMRCIAALCLHPIGYYTESWAGCMVPSDDVIAHLSFMRGDEAEFWKQANHHAGWHAEAGL